MRIVGLFLTLTLLVGCNSTQKIRTGQAAYDLKRYALAIELLEEELRNEYNRSKHFLLARSYAEIDLINESVRTYKDAVDAETPPQYLLEYAGILKRAEMYDDAIELYSILKTESNLDFILDKEIESCKLGKQWVLNPDTNVNMERLPLNSVQSDYAPSIVDGQLLFTTDRIVGLESDVYQWTGAAYSDIWAGSTTGTQEKIWSDQINTKDNEGTAILYPDANELYFTRCYSTQKEDGFCRIMRSTRTRNGWGKPEPVESLAGNFNVMHPAFSQDGQLLFFASDASGGIGGMDLYYCSRTETGWSKPTNLGQRINGEGDEVFPHLYRDTLYFASGSHPGMGGLDLFFSYFSEDGQWVRPVNLKSPFNSGADDFGIWIDTLNPSNDIHMKGYISSSRKGVAGRDDIFSFTKYKPKKPKKEDEDLPVFLTVKVVRPVYRKSGAPNSGIRRLVPVSDAQIEINDMVFTTDLTGVITQEIDSTSVYNIKASAKDLLAAAASFDGAKDLKNGAGYVRLILNPIFYNQEVVLKNIYYDFDKWDIREDAKPALDTLAKMLFDNPEIRIQLASHTDCRGDDDFNLDLSQKRANSAIEYLIESGILTDRLEAKGFGETRPYVQCVCQECDEEEHQLNRRTSFVILK